MRRYLPLGLLLAVLAHLSGCGENPSRPSVVAETPVNPPKTRARFIQVPWDISLFFNIPGGAVVAGATTAATSGGAAEGDNLTGTFVNSSGFAGTLTGVLTGNLENGTFNGSLSTITRNGCTAERSFSGPINSQMLNWSPGAHLNDCGGTSPLTSGIQVTAAPASAPPPCTYEAAATGTSVPTAGGSGTVTVTAGEGCTWFATSSADFVTLSASEGAANGTVQFTVAATTATTQRTAILVVAGQSFTITQAAAPPCVYRLDDTARTFSAAGAPAQVAMHTAAHCAWRAESDASWLRITSGASGSGEGTIRYEVDANAATQRVGRISATGGERLTVTQLGIVGSLTGTVTNSINGQPVAAATVILTPVPQGAPLNTTTNAAGVYTFANVQQGAYNVLIRRTGFDDARRSVTITAAQTTSLSATLVARPVALAISWNPNPTFVDPRNPSCGSTSPYCWPFTVTIEETNGTAATVNTWLVRFYTSVAATTPSTVDTRTGAQFAAVFGNPVPGGGSVSRSRQIVDDTPEGGALDYVLSGIDPYGRSFSYTSPRLSFSAFSVETPELAAPASVNRPPQEGEATRGSDIRIRR